MGWFLTRKKSRKSRGKTRTRASSASPRPWDPKRTVRALKIAGGLAVAGGLIAGWIPLERALEDYASRVKADPVLRDDVVLADAPAWMTQAVRLRVADTVAAQVSEDPLDGRTLRWAAAALEQVPWVAHVEQVRRTGDGTVEVRAAYRRPLAVVEARDGYHLVDAAGVRLPGLYFREQLSELPLPLIVGVTDAPPGRPGERWAGTDLQAGLDLVELLAGEPYFDQIRAFDVSRRDARGRLRLALRTESGLVRWGLPPGREQAIEPGPAEKMARLERIYHERGSIDAGGMVVEVFGPVVAAYRPAAASATQTGYSW